MRIQKFHCPHPSICRLRLAPTGTSVLGSSGSSVGPAGDGVLGAGVAGVGVGSRGVVGGGLVVLVGLLVLLVLAYFVECVKE